MDCGLAGQMTEAKKNSNETVWNEKLNGRFKKLRSQRSHPDIHKWVFLQISCFDSYSVSRNFNSDITSILSTYFILIIFLLMFFYQKDIKKQN
jgi:hypothetical protein